MHIYTDGGCHGNPGPGGWAWRLIEENGRVIDERYGYEERTTNNRMELSAVIDGLTEVKRLIAGNGSIENLSEIVVITDSQYVRHGITAWIHRWKVNGWRTAAKKPVKNEDLWRQLDELNLFLNPDWRWVKGHAGDEHNEACDQMVQTAIHSASA